MEKFKVGDKVRIKEDLKVDCKYNDGCYFDSEMEKYKGKTAVIKNNYIPEYLNYTVENANNYRYSLDIDDGMWSWSSSMLEKVEDKKHFKSLPRDFTGTIKIENGFIAEIVKEIVKEKKEILDKAEKEYLSAVIKPFRNRVLYIKKISAFSHKGMGFLEISLNGENCDLPYFEMDSMYKNMKTNREYTLKELGLD